MKERAEFDLAGERVWAEGLADAVSAARELSHIFDPQAMADHYAERLGQVLPSRHMLSVTRRGFEPPRFGVRPAATWEERAGPAEPGRLVELQGGILGDLLYAGAPAIVDDLAVPDEDAAAPFLSGQRSLIAMPLFEKGLAVEMVIETSDQPRAFDRERLPELVRLTNLLSRAAFFSRQLRELRRTHAKLDRDLAYIAGLQQALLPLATPRAPGTSITVKYRPSERSGGDYYDFFSAPDDRLSIILADVSGHGTATAVLMAVTHAIAHVYPRRASRPNRLLDFLNRNLSLRYTPGTNTYVTAFHGIYDPSRRRLAYSLAGHPSPRLRRNGVLIELAEARRPPLGLGSSQTYAEAIVEIQPGDDLVLFTDGVTEARDEAGETFGEDRMDEILAAPRGIEQAVDALSAAALAFASKCRDRDDMTILAVHFL